MADGRHIEFSRSAVSAMMVDKHLGDFSCPGTHWLAGSEKRRQHLFANGTSGQVLHYKSFPKLLLTIFLILWFCLSYKYDDTIKITSPASAYAFAIWLILSLLDHAVILRQFMYLTKLK